MSKQGRPATVTAKGAFSVNVRKGDGPEQHVMSRLEIESGEMVRTTVGGTRPIESRSRDVKVFLHQVLTQAEQDQLKQLRDAMPVSPILKEKQEGVAVTVLEDGSITCPNCVPVGVWADCPLCDGKGHLSMFRLEQWNDENPDEAWLVDAG